MTHDAAMKFGKLCQHHKKPVLQGDCHRQSAPASAQRDPQSLQTPHHTQRGDRLHRHRWTRGNAERNGGRHEDDGPQECPDYRTTNNLRKRRRGTRTAPSPDFIASISRTHSSAPPLAEAMDCRIVPSHLGVKSGNLQSSLAKAITQFRLFSRHDFRVVPADVVERADSPLLPVRFQMKPQVFKITTNPLGAWTYRFHCDGGFWIVKECDETKGLEPAGNGN